MSTAQKILQQLESYGLTKKGLNHYRFNSPLRPGADGMTCSLVLHDDEHGAWRDHKEEIGGSLYDLAKRLGIPTPTTAPEKYSQSHYTSLADYAQAHGVEAGVFEAAKWHETTRYNKPALAIPTKSGTRFRMLAGDNKFLNPTGYIACWYGLNTNTMQRVVSGQPLVYCNGEASVVVAQHFGLAAVTIAGGGEKTIPSALLEELKTWLGDCHPPVIIALDSDAKGMKAAQQVKRQFSGLGFEAHAVDLNLWNKGDLADFCALHQQDSLAALQALPTLTHDEIEERESALRGWRIITRQTLVNMPPIEWFLPGIVPKKSFGVVYGESGIGKSFYALDLALQLAGQHTVLYMIGEGEQGYAQRVLAWEHHHHRQAPNIHYCAGAVRLLDGEDYHTFLDALEPLKPEIVFIDTMARSMTGSDENSARDVGMFVEACDHIKRRFDCTVVIIHHTNKAGVQERGSGALRGASDFIIRLYDEDGLIGVECSKSKDAQPFKTHFKRLLPQLVTMQDKTVETAVIVDAEQITQTIDDPLTRNQHKVLEAMAMPIYADGVTWGELSEYLPEISRRSLTRALSSLKEFGYIAQPQKRAPYMVTDSGYSRLGRYGHCGHDENGLSEKSSVTTSATASTASTPSRVQDYYSQNDPLDTFGNDHLGAQTRTLLPGFTDTSATRPPSQYDLGA